MDTSPKNKEKLKKHQQEQKAAAAGQRASNGHTVRHNPKRNLTWVPNGGTPRRSYQL